MSSTGTATFDASLAYSPSSIDNKSTALLLLDYHEFIIKQIGEDAARAAEVASQMRNWAQQNNIPVFHALIDTKSLADTQPQMKLSSRRSQLEELSEKAPAMVDETSSLTTKTDKQTDEPTFRRTLGTVSAFSSPGLLSTLQDNNIRSLILCGLTTSGCTFSTTRAATDLGFVVTVVSDACADGVPGLHDMLVKYALPMTAHVASASEIQEERKRRA